MWHARDCVNVCRTSVFYVPYLYLVVYAIYSSTRTLSLSRYACVKALNECLTIIYLLLPISYCFFPMAVFVLITLQRTCLLFFNIQHTYACATHQSDLHLCIAYTAKRVNNFPFQFERCVFFSHGFLLTLELDNNCTENTTACCAMSACVTSLEGNSL